MPFIIPRGTSKQLIRRVLLSHSNQLDDQSRLLCSKLLVFVPETHDYLLKASSFINSLRRWSQKQKQTK